MNDASPEMLSLFCAALERPSAGERADYLDAACGSDAGLRSRVEALLRAHEHAGGFLRQGSPALAPCATAEGLTGERPGTAVGPYKLLEQIGEGGFGVVFLAEQTQPVRRQVALKVLKPGMDTRQVVARFEAERQALALMDHPNIAKIHDGGETASGRPYFVMELVKGVPITAFCDEAGLPVRERLALFVHVCRAVQHAHQKGIIHRDLKPTNVLVTHHDAAAVPKVIDFGIAKATAGPLTERTLFTQSTQLIGTPLYMSPEQAELNGLDMDTRSDVYSLGVLLYELLTGTTPFQSEALKKVGLDEIRRIIREEEPPTPSQRLRTLDGQACSTISGKRRADGRRLCQTLRGELDWIVMKALAKDRNGRYESAGALAADVLRYLHGEAVQACPPSPGYRFKKFVLRHRAALATAALVAAALLSATAVSFWQALEADRARTLAEEREANVDAQRRRAEDNLRTALRLIKTQQDMLAVIDYTSQSGVRPDERAAWLQPLVEVLRKLKEDRLEDPNHLFQLAGAHRNYARSLAELARFVEAQDNLRESASLYAHVAADFPGFADSRAARDRVPNVYIDLAEVQRGDGRPADAEKSYAEALRLFGKGNWAKGHLGPEGLTLSGQARCLLAAGRTEEAEALYRRALQLSPERSEVQVGWAWFLATRPDTDRRDPRQAVEFAKKDRGMSLVFARGDVLGVAQYRAGDWPAAATALGQAVQTPAGQANGAGFFLAMAHWRLGHKDEARKQYEQSVGWADKYRPRDLELLRFRAEAARLLEIKSK
jgi:serine/threonine protein kinase/tetratricopeptide (TPR) repeat protein